MEAARKFAEADKAISEKLDAAYVEEQRVIWERKAALEQLDDYIVRVKSSIEFNEELFDEAERKPLSDALTGAQDWLASHREADKDELTEHYEELKKVCDPFLEVYDEMEDERQAQLDLEEKMRQERRERIEAKQKQFEDLIILQKSSGLWRLESETALAKFFASG